MNSGRGNVEQVWVNEGGGIRKEVIQWIRLAWIHCRKTKCFHLTLSLLVCAASQSKIKHYLNKVFVRKANHNLCTFWTQKSVVDVAKWEILCDENQKLPLNQHSHAVGKFSKPENECRHIQGILFFSSHLLPFIGVCDVHAHFSSNESHDIFQIAIHGDFICARKKCRAILGIGNEIALGMHVFGKHFE